MPQKSRSSYTTTSPLCTDVVLQRLALPCSWQGLESAFEMPAPYFSAIFWKPLNGFLNTTKEMFMGEINNKCFYSLLSVCADAVEKQFGTLTNCVGFIDGIVIGMLRPADSGVQNAVYNEHKRIHLLNFQVVVTSDSVSLHSLGPIEGRRNDWIYYSCSEVNEQLAFVLKDVGMKYCISGNSGCKSRPYLEILFRGAHLFGAQCVFIESMSSVRVTVECMFKELKLYWSTLDYKKKLRINESPVAAVYLGAKLLSNIRNPTYASPIAQYFESEPLELVEYLSTVWKRGPVRSSRTRGRDKWCNTPLPAKQKEDDLIVQNKNVFYTSIKLFRFPHGVQNDAGAL